MRKMIKSCAKKEESDSKSEASADGWKKGINLVQQMYIAQQYQTDNDMALDKEVKNIEDDQLKGLWKKAKKAENALKRSWEIYTVHRVGPKRWKVPKEQSIG